MADCRRASGMTQSDVLCCCPMPPNLSDRHYEQAVQSAAQAPAPHTCAAPLSAAPRPRPQQPLQPLQPQQDQAQQQQQLLPPAAPQPRPVAHPQLPLLLLLAPRQPQLPRQEPPHPPEAAAAPWQWQGWRTASAQLCPSYLAAREAGRRLAAQPVRLPLLLLLLLPLLRAPLQLSVQLLLVPVL